MKEEQRIEQTSGVLLGSVGVFIDFSIFLSIDRISESLLGRSKNIKDHWWQQEQEEQHKQRKYWWNNLWNRIKGKLN